MAITNSKQLKSSRDDGERLKSDVATFASSIGLSSSHPSSGFNDADFRKTGLLNKPAASKPSISEGRKVANKRERTFKREERTKKHDEGGRAKPGVRVPQPSAGDFKQAIVKFKNLPKLPLMKASPLGVWHADAVELELKVIGDQAKKRIEIRDVDEWKDLVAKKKVLAERLLAQYVQEYEISRGQSGDIKLLMATQRSGTAADKVSAFSVMVGDNPIANMKSLDALLGMVTSKVGKRHALTGFEALKEIFISNLLPDRKLKTLFQQPLNSLTESKDGYSLLLFWHWEECLKQRYERFIFALEEASRDVLSILKDKALKTMYGLLRSKSEQERRLLSALVNKLGDPENKAASNADYHLSKLLADHPNMKAVVIDEVDNFLFRPRLGLRSKYHAVNFLSQTRLSHRGEGPKVAKKLVDIYFALFKVVISEGDGLKMEKKGKKDNGKFSGFSKDKDIKTLEESHVEMDSRLLSALLTGVNRAFPFVSSNEADDIIEAQTPVLFQLVHSKNFNVGVQALMLLDKISSKNQIVSDRFYRALYSKLLLPAVMNSSKEEMFVGLLLRAMKNDINLKRVSAFAKRLLQVALQQPPQYACGCIFLLSEVLKARPLLWNMVLQHESAGEDLEHFEDIMEEEENQTSSWPGEPDNGGIANGNNGSDIDGDYSVGARSSRSGPEAEADEDVDFIGINSLSDCQKPELTSIPSEDQKEISCKTPSLPGGYTPRHREPSHCMADRVSWWELMVLGSHVHPSVATMARTLLSGAKIVYNGNPLNDLSLTAFLDKLTEKKAKQGTWHGGSQIEPSKKLEMNHHLIGAEIASLEEMDVPPEDLIFHKFYVNKMNSSKKPTKKKKKKGTEKEDAEELFAGAGDDDESDNDGIETILDSANPSLDGDGDYSYDDLDQIAIEDDDDLVGNASDKDIKYSLGSNADDAAANDISDGDVGESGGINFGEADDGSDNEEAFHGSKRKRQVNAKAGVSPFASLEDYEHLFNEEDSENQKTGHTRQLKAKKKRKSSK